MPSKEKSLLIQLAELNHLSKAWRVVRRSAMQSLSENIKNLAKEFDHNLIQNLRHIGHELSKGRFEFEKVTARPIPRPGKRPRPIASAPIASRVVQRAILDLLWSNQNIKSLVKTDNSFGGIEGKGVKEALTVVSQCIQNNYRYYITSDILDFFQNINTKEVNSQIFQLLDDNSINSIIENALHCEIDNISDKEVQRNLDLFPTDEKGVIQGCCLSPLYGNILLYDFDSIINSISNIRCVRYIDDFIILGKHEHSLKDAFSVALNILGKKGLRAYTLDEKDTKAKSGTSKHPIEFLGCSIRKGQISPTKKTKNKLLVKMDEHFDESLKEMKNAKLNSPIRLSYLKTTSNVNNVLKGWGGAYSFCNDHAFFNNLDKEIRNRFKSFYKSYSDIRSRATNEHERQRLFGLQLTSDCIDKDPIWGPKGILKKIN